MPENFRAELETFIHAAQPKRNPWHLPPIMVLSYIIKESMLATTSIELRNMRADKKEILKKKKRKNLLKSRGQTYLLIPLYLDPKSRKMKILIFGVKIFQHI